MGLRVLERHVLARAEPSIVRSWPAA